MDNVIEFPKREQPESPAAYEDNPLDIIYDDLIDQLATNTDITNMDIAHFLLDMQVLLADLIEGDNDLCIKFSKLVYEYDNEVV